MKLLIDNQLPLTLARHFTENGHDCLHVLDLGLETASDTAVWARAVSENRIVVSKDEDFVFLANRPGDSGRLIWVRLGNCRNPALLDAIDRMLASIVAALETGQRIIEVR